ncbi:MAG: DNA double-strand break repair nuclease NurA [Crenarchaeota archaeon]|nr:DNA double-strand break repair nuclease NurA [Thermoproteota archaeon]
MDIFDGLTKEITRLMRKTGKSGMYINIDESEVLEPLYEARIEHVSNDRIHAPQDKIIELVEPKSLAGWTDLSVSLYGIDSSTRTITSPFFFIGIGFGVGVDYRRGDRIECPSITSLISKSPIVCRECKWIILIPFSEEAGNICDNPCIMARNPAGTPYDTSYNRYAALDELRLVIENYILSSILGKQNYLGSRVILLDGPIYMVPKLVTMYAYLKPPSRGRIDDYIASWKTIVKHRIDLLKHKDSDTLVYGIVKRLDNSYILSRIDPARLTHGARINDQAYLILFTQKVFKNAIAKPFIIGPIKIDPPKELGEIPPKIIYYVGLPRHKYTANTGVAPYGFYRVEFLAEELRNILKKYDKPYIPSLMDSLISGTVIPLSILIADKIAKDVSRGIANYFIRLLEDNGVPLTYDSMRSIEGYFVE